MKTHYDFTDEDRDSMAAALIAEASGMIFGHGKLAVDLGKIDRARVAAGHPTWMWLRLASTALDHFGYLPTVCEERAKAAEDQYFLSCGL